MVKEITDNLPACGLIWAIHGNLQLPEVWSEFSNRFYCDRRRATPAEVRTFSIWQAPGYDFRALARELNCCALAEKNAEKNKAKQIALGYSQGGRLALHAIIAAPELWSGAVLVGAHPGLASEEEKKARLESDRRWASRFLSEPWAELMTEWDSQPIFGGKPNRAPRREEEFSRPAIARVFENLSLGRQENLRPSLAAAALPPVLFISGEGDPRFAALGRELAALNENITHRAVKNAGHRVPWDNPEGFIDAVQEFLLSAVFPLK